MLTLNLIDPELKKEIKHRNLFKLIIKGCNLLILLSIFIFLYISLGWYILHNNYNDIINQTSLDLKDSESYDSKISTINSQINTIAEIQKNYYILSNILNNLMINTAQGIKLSSIRIDRIKKIIDLQGQAAYRDNLLTFKDNLINSKVFEDIDLPISNILQKENVDFQISAKFELSNEY